MTRSSGKQIPAPLAAAQIPEVILDVVRTLRGAGFQAFLVGGCVRDMVRGAPIKDYDVATSAKPQEVKKLFRRVVETGIAHGTVSVIVKPNLPVEVTTFRGEGKYLDGRRPSEIRFLDAIDDDLARRDFTINAMAFDPTEPRFEDPFDGIADLERRLVRCVGAATERFDEDGLRAMRAVRFASTFEFALDAATQAAISPARETFRKVAVERLREEFSKILTGPSPSRGLKLLGDTGLMTDFLPELSVDRDFEHVLATVDAMRPSIEGRLAALTHCLGAPSCTSKRTSAVSQLASEVLERLRYPRRTIELASLLVECLAIVDDMAETDAAVRRLLARLGAKNGEQFADLIRAHGAASSANADAVARAQRMSQRLLEIRDQHPPLVPADLALSGGEVTQELGGKAGPRVGEAVRFLLERVLDDPRINEASTLRRLLREWNDSHTAKTDR